MNVQKAGRLLLDLLERYEDMEGKVEEIAALERFGDEVADQTVKALQDSRPAHIGRSAAAALAAALDGVVDGISSAATAMLAYRLEAATEHAHASAALIAKACADLNKAVGLLGERPSDWPGILAYTASVRAAAAQHQRQSGGALAPLFSDGQDPLTVLKWRDVYTHLDHALAEARHTAQTLEAMYHHRR